LSEYNTKYVWEGGFIMNKKVWVMTIVLSVGLLMNSGCALLVGGAAGAGTVAYLKGELKTNEDVPIDKLWNATQAAIKEMGFTVKKFEKAASSAQFVALTADDKTITIKLKKRNDFLTEITIRAGTFGDESLSKKILEEIRKHY
jgi:hypothetical protein